MTIERHRQTGWIARKITSEEAKPGSTELVGFNYFLGDPICIMVRDKNSILQTHADGTKSKLYEEDAINKRHFRTPFLLKVFTRTGYRVSYSWRPSPKNP